MKKCIYFFLLVLGGCGGSGGSPAAVGPTSPPLDTTPPVITLLGDNPQVITTGTAYAEWGATAMDDVDGDVSGSIVIDSNTVDISTAGSYSVTYDVTDSSGNRAATVIRTVAVQDPPLSTGPEICTNGSAGDFPCSGISLRKRVSYESMGGSNGSANGIWGWFDTQSGNEYALLSLGADGTAFVDVSDPEVPVFLGRLRGNSRDIKVYQDHAYTSGSNGGMRVFDLTRLRGLVSPQIFSADVIYGDFESAHNLALNEDSGFAYAVQTDTCGGGLHIIDIRTLNNPLFAGCHSTVQTHNTQCVIYQGPDVDHPNNPEICVSSNKDHLEVVDVTNKTAPVTISTTTYPQLAQVHQGWLSEDHRFFLLGDESDENAFNVPTRTHVFDVSNLDALEYVFAYEAGTASIDHNLFIFGNRVFEANHTSGLRVLEFGDLANRELIEIAFFDTYPTDDDTGGMGARSVYPYFPSGNIIVSDRNSGLFILSIQ